MERMSGPTPRWPTAWRLQKSLRGTWLLRWRFPPEHGNRFDFDQQIRPAENRLNAGGSRQRVELLLFVECGALFVEGLVIAFDVAEVAGGTHDVVPGSAFRSQQLADVVEGAAELSTQISYMDGAAGIVYACGTRDQQDGEAVQVNPHPAGEGAAVVVGFVERRVIGDGPLHDGGCGHFREQLLNIHLISS